MKKTPLNNYKNNKGISVKKAAVSLHSLQLHSYIQSRLGSKTDSKSFHNIHYDENWDSKHALIDFIIPKLASITVSIINQH